MKDRLDKFKRYMDDRFERYWYLIHLFKLAWIAWRRLKPGSIGYYQASVHGVPKVAIFVGFGREAWRISQRAVEEFEVKPL